RSSDLYYINLSQDDFKLGGSSFAQILNKSGSEAPTIKDADFFKRAFNVFQDLIKSDLIQAGHDIGSGGLITTLLEMCFAENNLGADFDFSALSEKDTAKLLFAVHIGIVFQAKPEAEAILAQNNIVLFNIGKSSDTDTLS